MLLDKNGFMVVSNKKRPAFRVRFWSYVRRTPSPRSVPLALLLQAAHSLLGSSARLNVRGATNGLVVVVVRACATRCRDCTAVNACGRRMHSGRQRDRTALLKAARGFSRPNATRTEALPCCPRCGRLAGFGSGRLLARVSAMPHEQQAGFLNPLPAV